MEPFYLDGAVGRIFCVYFPPAPAQPPKTNVIFLPPFADELNKSRHTAARLARALAAVGCGTLLLDLYGTGDSEGDFEDGRWRVWRDDVLAAIAWLNERADARLVFLGLRLGGLLAMDIAANHRGVADSVVLWNPVVSGKVHIGQFLRFRTVSLIGGDNNDRRQSTSDLRERLQRGETVNVAGYRLSAALAGDIEQLTLNAVGGGCNVPVDWFEVVANRDSEIAPASARLLQVWRDAGHVVTLHTVADKPFWALQTIGPVWGDELIAQSVRRLQ